MWFATVGGIGRLPVAPGTWGSLVGLLSGALAARIITPPRSLVVLAFTFVICAFICTQAERALGQPDPPAVVLDEVWGMASILLVLPRMASSGSLLAVAFLLFRFFDIAKLPPLRRLERLPVGWGIMADDLGAAIYAVLTLWVVTGITGG